MSSTIFFPLLPLDQPDDSDLQFGAPESLRQTTAVAEITFDLETRSSAVNRNRQGDDQDHPFIRRLRDGADRHLDRPARAAIQAVRKLAPKPSVLTCPYQFFGRGRTEWLADVTPAIQSPSGLDWSGESATLGIALGLLGAMMARDGTRVIATGNLEGHPDRDGTQIGSGIKVTPIGGLEAKLEAVETWARANRPKHPVAFLVPFQDGDETPLTPRAFKKRYCSGRGNWHRRLQAVGVRLCPVDNLQSAIRLLRWHRLRPTLWDRLVQGAVVGSVAVLACWGVDEYMSNRPIAMTHAPVVDAGGTVVATPYRSPDGNPANARPLCRTSDGVPAVAAGDWLYFNIRFAPRSETARLPEGPYYPALVMIPEFVVPGNTIKAEFPYGDGCSEGPVSAGNSWCLGIPTEANRYEDNAVIAIAAHRAGEVEAEHQRLINRHAQVPPGAQRRRIDISNVISDAKRSFSGRVLDDEIVSRFRTVPRDQCP